MFARVTRTLIVLLAASSFFVAPATVQAQASKGTPEAKAQFEQGEAARKAGDFAKAAASFRKAIELDPKFLEAHESFVSATQRVASDAAKPPIWAQSTAYKSGDLVRGGRGTFRCTQAGTSGAEAPAWDTAGARVTDNGVIWQKLEQQELSDLTSKASKAAQDQTIKIYEEWAAKNPKNAIIPYELGHLHDYRDKTKAEQYYRKANELDPKFADVYMQLSLYAEMRGNEVAARDLLKKAMDNASADDPSYYFYYIQKFREDRATYRKMTFDLAAKRPAMDRKANGLKEERPAQGLYWLGETAATEAEKIEVFERLKTSYPPDKYSWSGSGMSGLFGAYAKSDPKKALALAQEMAKLLPESKQWKDTAAYQEAVMQARSLLAAGKFTEAATLLEQKLTPPYAVGPNEMTLLRAEAANGAGKPAEAYDATAKQLAKEPNAELQAALLKYAKGLNKTPQDANAEVWKLREADAKPVPDFSLGLYTEDKKVSPADLKGKVVLLNFWYPG